MTEQETNTIEEWDYASMEQVEQGDSAEIDLVETTFNDEFVFPEYECFC